MSYLRYLHAAALLLVSNPLSAADIYLVVDGDTVMIEGRRFNLRGIAAPALDEICTTSDGSTWPCGSKARDQLAEAMVSGEPVCRIVGRETVSCRAAGFDVGALLVKEGLAKAVGDYGDIESRARAAKVGLWQ